MGSEIEIWGFLQKSSSFIQNTTCVRLSKENLLCSYNAPEIHIFNSWRHQKLLLVANQLQDSTFFKNINSKDIGISNLVSQLKLLPSLFELKDNGTGVMSTIIKKLQDRSQNRSLFINEVEKIVRLLLLSPWNYNISMLSQFTNTESDGA